MRPCKILGTYDCHLGSILNIIKKVRNHSDGVFLVSPGLIVKILQKNQACNITYHTYHMLHM